MSLPGMNHMVIWQKPPNETSHAEKRTLLTCPLATVLRKLKISKTIVWHVPFGQLVSSFDDTTWVYFCLSNL